MKEKLQSRFSTRQYMLSRDFELYYYHDRDLARVELHSHPYYEFYFFLEGDVNMQIQDGVYPLRPGDTVLVPPNVPHRMQIRSQDIPYRRFVFWISREYWARLTDAFPDYGYLMEYVPAKKTYVFHNDRMTFNTIQSMLLRILEEMHGNRFGREAQISLCVGDLLLYLSRVVHERDAQHPENSQDTLCLGVIRYIEAHLTEDLTLEKLAEAFYVSKYHIAHTFRENMGISVHQYITKKRLALCREALLGRMSVTEAFLTFGFGDYSSFYRAFKKEYGFSPREFRDMQTAGLPESGK